MKQCRECGTLSPDDTVFCYICGTKFNDFEENLSDYTTAESLTEDQESGKSIPTTAKSNTGEEKILFDGVYQYRYPDYSSYLRFFPDGKVVEVGSTGTPSQVGQWLNHEYESFGFYTINDGAVSFVIASSSGQVSYLGRILKEAIEMDVTSHINGYNASDLRYNYCSLL